MKRYNLLTISILILGIAAIFVVQFATPTLYGADGYLHIRMAEFLRDMGPRYDFHWARYSVFVEHFGDKDFLYHVVLIPFTFFKNIFFGAKLAAAIFASFLFAGFYFMLKRYSARPVLPFFLIAFFFSDLFLHAISRPRPVTLVLLINILAVHLIIKKKSLWVFLLALMYSLSHVTSFLIISSAFIVEIVRYINKKEFYAKTLMGAILGVALGFLIHPNFPNNLYVFYLNSVLFPIYTIKTGVLEIGAEMFPLNSRDYLLSYPVIIIGIILLVFISMYKRPKTSFETNVFLTLAVIFFPFSFICQRYLQDGYLFMLIGFSAYISDAVIDIKKINKNIIICLCIVALALGFNSYKNVRYNSLATRISNTHYEQVARWMERNIPEGSSYFIATGPTASIL